MFHFFQQENRTITNTNHVTRKTEAEYGENSCVVPYPSLCHQIITLQRPLLNILHGNNSTYVSYGCAKSLNSYYTFAFVFCYAFFRC